MLAFTTHLSTQRVPELAMLADIQWTVYPENVTRQLHIMVQARESLTTVLCRQFELYRANNELCVLHSSPFRSSPLNTAGSLGECSKLPVDSGAKPQPTNDFMHIGVKNSISGSSSFC